MQVRICKGCKKSLLLTAFTVRGGRVNKRCDKCLAPSRKAQAKPGYKKISRENARKWNEINPVQRRAINFKSRYDLALDDYERLRFSQGNRCAICERPANPNEWLAVDHDHTTEVIRGLLCQTCNRGLGHFKDDLQLLYRACRYLEGGIWKVKSVGGSIDSSLPTAQLLN